jgi:hypothetical protein
MDQPPPDEKVVETSDELRDDTGDDTGDRSTGIAEVDAVLASLDGLADQPVADHVAVFEQAHDRLRRALDAPSG